MLKSAAKRKGGKWPLGRHDAAFQVYIKKNKHLFLEVFTLYDLGLTVRKISLRMGISWDRVNYMILNRQRINTS